MLFMLFESSVETVSLESKTREITNSFDVLGTFALFISLASAGFAKLGLWLQGNKRLCLEARDGVLVLFSTNFLWSRVITSASFKIGDGGSATAETILKTIGAFLGASRAQDKELTLQTQQGECINFVVEGRTMSVQLPATL